MSTNDQAAMMLRQYADDDEGRADDDEKYSNGTHAASLRERAETALALAAKLEADRSES